MIHSLLQRKIEKRPDKVRLEGRILFLTEDPELIQRQLAGEDLSWDTRNPAANPKLRDDISTDEITPAHYCFYFDQTLGEIPYLGLKCGNVLPVGRGDVKRGGFVCAVSGKRRGKGSSREQSPYAEMCAGIRVVIAENIERIYKQNCQNLGLLTSTNFSLIDRIRRREEIALSEFTAGEDEITRQVIEYGGLFPFNVARMQGKVFLPPIQSPGKSARAAPAMTLAEKIFARHMINERGEVGVASVKPGDTGFARADLRFSHEYVTPMAAIFFEQYVGKDAKVNDPASILFFRDHLTFLDEVISEEKKKLGLLDLATQLKFKQQDFARKQGIKLHGELTDRKGSEGICHSIVLESYALPGQLNIGSDSHTPHVGAIGCIAFGIGTTDVFNSWITKDVRVRVPESVRIVIRGRKHPNVTAKDFILKILSLDYVRSGKALAKVMEYAGEAIEELSVDERATMTNMAAEIGGFTGIVAPDKKAVDFLVERRGMKRTEAEGMGAGLYSDRDAQYAHVIELDAAEITPMVATPGDPGNGKYIRELNSPVPVEIAYGGTCTAGKNEDMEMYALVLADALKHGKRVADGVKFYIQFGSQETRDYCVRRGYLEVFRKAGAQVIEPSCGACINAGPGVSTRPDQVVISAQNRNFPGRSGPGQMYLASPLTVAASAVAGYIVEYEPSEKRELVGA
ncbi:3-isopropylmalate dehydratase [Candidatus Sulfotelmatobacter kueseliae]|uniref:3-isopropylmalate dehydratase n=1 Tax=Candidatus Sulfotelmatobacter kueseliae TaxID=2042962 RepID=A0A2U3KLE5_9BACT|nr:3-isopropylmalate dehydratase [Candidatus Sulfotelmatobacter kueseliae]